MSGSAGSMVARAGRAAYTAFGPALKVRAVLLIIVAVAMLYVTALLAVVYAYRKGYGIVGSQNSRSGSRPKKRRPMPFI